MVDQHNARVATRGFFEIKTPTTPGIPKASGKRIRQKSKTMNRLEVSYFNTMKSRFGVKHMRFAALTFSIANGLRYTPDFTYVLDIPTELNHSGNNRVAVEIKGPKAFDGALDKLKMAAHEFPDWDFWLVWKDKTTGEWTGQRVLP